MTDPEETFLLYLNHLLEGAEKGRYRTVVRKKAIADETGFSESKISRICSGETKTPSGEDIVAITEAALACGPQHAAEKYTLSKLYRKRFGTVLDFNGLPPDLRALEAAEQDIYIYLFICNAPKSIHHINALFGTSATHILGTLVQLGYIECNENSTNELFQIAIDPAGRAGIAHEVSRGIFVDIRDGFPQRLSRYPLVEMGESEEAIRERKDFLADILGWVDELEMDRHRFVILLAQRLASLREADSYLAGNLINLLITATNGELSQKNLSGLIIRHADFRAVRMHGADLSGARIHDCRFSDTFGSVWKTGFLPDERFYAASTVSGTVKVWNSRSGQLRRDLGKNDHTIHGWSFAFAAHANSRGSPNPDVSIASAGGSGEVRYWDNAFDAAKPSISFQAHETRVRGIHFLKKGRIITCGEDGTIKAWTPDFGEFSEQVLINTGVRWSSLAISDDDTLLAAGNLNGEIYYTNPSSSAPDFTRVEPCGHTGNINCLAVSADGSHMLSTDDECEVRTWKISHNADNVVVQLENRISTSTMSVKSCAFMGEGFNEFVLGYDDGTISFWHRTDENTYEKGYSHPAAHTSFIRSLASSRDASRLVSGGDDQTIHLWQIERNTAGRVTAIHPRQSHSGVIASARAADHHPDKNILATGHDDGRIRFWTNDKQLVESKGIPATHAHNKGRIWSLKFCRSLSGEVMLISAGEDGLIKGWKGDGSALAFQSDTAHTYRVFAVDVCNTQAGWIVSGGQDKTIRLWTLDGQQTHCKKEAHTGRVRDVCILPDTQTVVSCGEDGKARVWEVEAGRLKGPVMVISAESNLTRIVARQDGTRLYFACDNGKILSCCPTTGATVTSGQISRRPLLALGLVRDETAIACGGEDGRIYLLNSSDLSSLQVPIQCHTDWIEDISVSKHNRSFVTVSDDQLINRFDETASFGKRQTTTASLDYEGMIITALKGDDATSTLLEKLRALGATEEQEV